MEDSAGQGLQGANIVLYPDDKTLPPAFAVSDRNGEFMLMATKAIPYALNITFMGFEPIKGPIVFNKERTERAFVLKEALNELEEVVINYAPPIKIKKDTTTYQVDAFVSGKERKLGEVLKKLPGVSVNREGEVFFKNKRVKKVLVENRTFFTGQPKMATRNVPADVIDQVQMIEDYSETPFLKEFENSDHLVMNILLREDGKKFIFGSIESAVGHRDRYRFHPTIFKYSPTLVHNFMGDLNNTANRSFTLSDYISMEGEQGAQGIIDAFNSPISKFLQVDEFYKNNHYFGGYNFQYNPNRIHELRFFVLGMLDRSQNQELDSYTYQASQSMEQRSNHLSNKHQILYGKLKYKYSPDLYTVIKMDAAFNYADLKGDGSNHSNLDGEQRDYSLARNLGSQKFTLNATAEKWFSGNNVSIAELKFSHQGESSENAWNSPLNIFARSIPLSESDNYRLGNFGTGKHTDFDWDLKHHYRPSRADMISFGFNGTIQKAHFENMAKQYFDPGEAIALDGFSNVFGTLLSEINSSVSYKWYMAKSLTVDFGAVYKNVFWKDRQLPMDHVQAGSHLLPLAKIEWNFEEKKSLEFSYNASVTNPGPESKRVGSIISDFNQITAGNPNLTQPTTHRALLSLSLFKAYGFSFYARLGHRKHKDAIVQNIVLDGIEGKVTPFQSGSAMDSYDISLRGRYNRRYWKVSLENAYYIRESGSVFNGEQRFNDSFNVTNNLLFSTTFVEAPNVELEISNSYYRYSNPFFTNETMDTDIDISASYDHGDWKFELTTFQNFYENKSRSSGSYINLIGAKVFYQKEDSPLEIGLEAYNLGNSVHRISTLYNSVYFAEYKRSIFPRTLLFSLNYKL